MKKLTRILCLVLVVAMAALMCVSCGETVEQRLETAIANLLAAKKTDVTGEMTIKMDMGGMKIEMPMTITTKSDMSDEANPAVYAKMVMSMMGETMDAETWYKDGYLYTNSMGMKYKVQMTYDEVLEQGSTGEVDIISLLEAKKDDLENGVVITENDDGSLTVKMTLTAAEYGEKLEEVFASIYGEMDVDANVTVADTVFELTINGSNEITNIKASIAVSMTVEGVASDVVLDMDLTYNKVGEDFAVTLPEDADDYIKTTLN